MRSSPSFTRTICLLLLCAFISDASAGSTHPYYKRRKPAPQSESAFLNHNFIDWYRTHADAYPTNSGDLSLYTSMYDARAAGVLRSAVGVFENISLFPNPAPDADRGLDVLEYKDYGSDGPQFYSVTSKALAMMAYDDYFPNSTNSVDLRGMVSAAIMLASPGWCGTFGPGVDNVFDLLGDLPEGNYDMTEMHLLHIAYSYYDELTAEARERLITFLLQQGRIQRVNEGESYTVGGAPDDWTRAGWISVFGIHKTIDETENHVLMIMTARYLNNQLAFQRDHDISHDNLRNGSDERPSCTDIILSLLYNILRDDFSEYNAKPYQRETRTALLNLCTYAYDDRVRLAARMVLDYTAAHFAVSSCDLRRMIPFRRRNEPPYNNTFPGGDVMDVGLVDEPFGAESIIQFFALEAGNLRILEFPNLLGIPGSKCYDCQDHDQCPNFHLCTMRPAQWAIADRGMELAMEIASDYRLPPMIHDLFVNDSHRRFFQRLRRIPRAEAGGNRNCDNMEIYAGSPSYLISAGGQPAIWAIDPRVDGTDPTPSKNNQQKGFAVTTSFIPTGNSAGAPPDLARDVLQFGAASSGFDPNLVENYGVGPDFACGFMVHTPQWILDYGGPPTSGQFRFINLGSDGTRPGFYMALFTETNGFTVMEVFDTWRHHDVTFEQFRAGVLARNGSIHLESNVESDYTTQNGKHMHFVIWNNGERNNTERGTRVLHVDYGDIDREDGDNDAGNNTDHFLNGTILFSPAEAVVEISNPGLGKKIILDMSDKWHPKRTAETGWIQQTGYNNEVWVDFAWTGESEGDFGRPFKTLSAAMAAVADNGVIKVMPGSSSETATLNGKHATIIAPIGGVSVGKP